MSLKDKIKEARKTGDVIVIDDLDKFLDVHDPAAILEWLNDINFKINGEYCGR